jgi:hypothetical protein
MEQLTVRAISKLSRVEVFGVVVQYRSSASPDFDGIRRLSLSERLVADTMALLIAS